MIISGKTWLMTILKVTKSQGFTLSLESKFLEKLQRGQNRVKIAFGQFHYVLFVIRGFRFALLDLLLSVTFINYTFQDVWSNLVSNETNGERVIQVIKVIECNLLISRIVPIILLFSFKVIWILWISNPNI